MNAPSSPNGTTVEADRAILILIDAQPLFLEGMAGEPEPVLVRLEHLLKLAEWIEIPVVATFEHPTDRKGWLPQRLEEVFPPGGQRFVKHTFDLTAEPEIRDSLVSQPRRQALVAGSESDVCVLQSVLGLLHLNFQVFLLVDCLFSSEQHPDPALRRMQSAGAVPLTYKMLYYELKRTVDVPVPHKTWNEAELIAGRCGNRFLAPEDLPAWHGNAGPPP